MLNLSQAPSSWRLMNQLFLKEILRVGGDPADEIWNWLVMRGPHGPSFTWGQTRSEPAGFVGVNLLEKVSDEMTVSVVNFKNRARFVVGLAMKSNVSELVRRGIQVAAVVGGQEELEIVNRLTQSTDAAIGADARACSFYLKRRIYC